MAISKPGNQKLEAGKLFMINTPIKMEMMADRTNQNH